MSSIAGWCRDHEAELAEEAKEKKMSAERSRDAAAELAAREKGIVEGRSVLPMTRFPNGLVLVSGETVKGVVMCDVVVYTVMMPAHGPERETIHSRYLRKEDAHAHANKNPGYSVTDPKMDIFITEDGKVARLIGPEVYTQDQESLRKTALAKLTPQERRALGIYDVGI